MCECFTQSQTKLSPIHIKTMSHHLDLLDPELGDADRNVDRVRDFLDRLAARDVQSPAAPGMSSSRNTTRGGRGLLAVNQPNPTDLPFFPSNFCSISHMFSSFLESSAQYIDFLQLSGIFRNSGKIPRKCRRNKEEVYKCW